MDYLFRRHGLLFGAQPPAARLCAGSSTPLLAGSLPHQTPAPPLARAWEWFYGCRECRIRFFRRSRARGNGAPGSLPVSCLSW